jgi:hypothetical protein
LDALERWGGTGGTRPRRIVVLGAAAVKLSRAQQR